MENKKEELQRQIQSCKADDDSGKVLDAARLVRQFVDGFEEEFSRVSQEERKVMIQKCIAGIVIDREALVARFNGNRIPALTPDIERALNSAGNEDSFVSCQSARDPELSITHTTPSGD